MQNVLQVDIPIHVVEGDSMFVTFEGHGFDERDSERLQVKDGCITVPCTQKIPIPGQVRKDKWLMIQNTHNKSSPENRNAVCV